MGGLIFGCNVIVLGVYMHGMFPWGKWFLSVSNESFKFSWRDVTLKNIFVKILPNQMTAQELGRLVKGFLIHPKKWFRRHCVLPNRVWPQKGMAVVRWTIIASLDVHAPREQSTYRVCKHVHIQQLDVATDVGECIMPLVWVGHLPVLIFVLSDQTQRPKSLASFAASTPATSFFFVNIFQNVKLEEGTFLKTSWFAVAAVWEWSSWKLGCIETRSCRMIHIYIQVSLGKPHVTACLNSPTAIHQKNDPILVQTTHLASQLSSEPQNPLLKVYFQNHFLRRDDAPLRLNLMTFYFQVKLVIVSQCQSIQSM